MKNFCFVSAIPLPKNALLNSTNAAVQLFQYFRIAGSANPCSNRGVGGIDAPFTAAGAAIADTRRDSPCWSPRLAFYDSNALWNEELSPNLRIILINNGGGSIFAYYSVGPDQLPPTEYNAVLTRPLPSMPNLWRSCIIWIKPACSNEKQLKQALASFFGKSDRAKILEIKSDKALSAKYCNYFAVFSKNVFKIYLKVPLLKMVLLSFFPKSFIKLTWR
ncbi:MAG: hypothetical protein IPL35_04230 [Sphingobacteriales bacterium]|nr:hypothetical protein [Sphingobacteriales bacterium]